MEKRPLVKKAMLLEKQALMKEAITRLHNDIQRTVENEATRRGFVEDLPPFHDPLADIDRKPDVFRFKESASEWHIFLADAKATEKPATCEGQIQAYVDHFVDRLGEMRDGKPFRRGHVMIGAPTQKLAKGWAELLDECADGRLFRGGGGVAKFQVHALGLYFVAM